MISIVITKDKVESLDAAFILSQWSTWFCIDVHSFIRKMQKLEEILSRWTHWQSSCCFFQWWMHLCSLPVFFCPSKPLFKKQQLSIFLATWPKSFPQSLTAKCKILKDSPVSSLLIIPKCVLSTSNWASSSGSLIPATSAVYKALLDHLQSKYFLV